MFANTGREGSSSSCLTVVLKKKSLIVYGLQRFYDGLKDI
jgi:hypothetical protein